MLTFMPPSIIRCWPLTNRTSHQAIRAARFSFRRAGGWKLAAINYAVDVLYTDAAGATIHCARCGLRCPRLSTLRIPRIRHILSLITEAPPRPTGFYSTQISSKLVWIYSVIAPAGDVNGNGISNHLDYARDLNSPAPAGPGAPPASRPERLLSP